MSERDVSVAIRYVLEVTQKGVAQAVAMTRDLGTVSKETAAGVSASMDAVNKQYIGLAKAAVKADGDVAKSAIDCSVTVNKALDAQIAKLRDAGNSYSAIVAKQKELGVSGAQLASSIEASSKREIAAMQAVRAEADRTVTQRVKSSLSSLSSAGSKIGGAAASAARGAGGLALGGAALGAGLAYEGLEKSRSVTEGTLAISGATGLGPKNSLALSTIGAALGISPRSIGQSFGTLGSEATKALAGNKAAGSAFQALPGFDRTLLAKDINDPLRLFDQVTKATQALPATQQAAVQRTLLGRGSSIVGQLTEGGSLGGQVQGVKSDLPNIKPATLVEMQHEFVQLKEVTTAFELSFAQAFGPTIEKVLKAVIPLMKPLGSAMQGAFKDIGNFFKGSTGKAIVDGLTTFGAQALAAGKQLISAFKPAEPFFQNVLLPLVKGVAIGIGVGLIGAIKLVTDGVKVLAPVLGFLGNVLSPLKGVIQDVGEVLGVVFSGDALGGIAKGVGAVVGEIPFLGKVLEAVVKPVEVVGDGISGLYKIISGAFGKALDFMGGLPAKFSSVLSGAGAAIVGAFAALPGQMLSLGESVVKAIVSGIEQAPNAIIKALTGLLPKPLRGVASSIFGAAASAIPVGAFSSALNAVGLATGGWVPGDPHRDGTLAMLSGNEFVLTGHGQGMLDSYAPGLLDHIAASQLPHFVSGGKVGTSGYKGFDFTSTKAPAKVNTYITPGTASTVEHVTAAQYHQQEIAAKVKKASTIPLSWKTIGATVYDDSGATSSGKHLSRGFAELSPAGISSSAVNFSSATALGQLAYGTQLMIRKTPNSQPVTGAKDDIGRGQGNNFYKLDMGRALSQALGVSTSAFKGSIQIAAPNPGESFSSLGAVSADKVIKPPVLANQVSQFTPASSFGAGFQAGLAGTTLSDTLKSGFLHDLIGDMAVTVSQSGLIAGSTTPTGVAGPAATGSLAKMIAAATAINAKHYPYEYGGGHNNSFAPSPGTVKGSLPGVGYDCSAAVSAVLHAGGALKAPPLTAGQFMGWGQSGKGKSVSIFASPAHTFMQLDGRYFGTSAAQNPRGGAGWIKNFPEAMPATRHPPGMRRGGYIGATRIPKFSFGGLVSGAASLARPQVSPIATVTALGKLPDRTSGQVTALMTQLAAAIDDTTKQTIGSLESLVTALGKSSMKKGLDTIQARRIDDSINAVEYQIGQRVGAMITAQQTKVDQAFAVKIPTSAGSQAVYGSQAFSNLLSRQGIDPSSTQGLLSGEAFQKATAQALNNQIGVLNQALTIAKKHKDTATITTITGDLNTALANLDNATTQALVDAKQAIESAAQDILDNATQTLSLAQGGETTLDLTQQLNGTSGTPAGGAQMADYINNTMIPALRGVIAGDENVEATDAAQGDTKGAQAAALKLQGDNNTLLQYQLDALNAIKNTSQDSANALKTFGGSIGLIFNNQNVADFPLAGFLTGT